MYHFFQQAGLLRTEHGEYWIEPSNQLATDNTNGRPHVIFKRSAVDKVAAYHRAKRAVNSNKNPYNTNTNPTYKVQEQKKYEARRLRESKEAKDKRRRQYLEDRRRRLEALRRNPTDFRRQQWKLRMEQRRARTYPSASKSSSNSLEANSEASKSYEQLIQSKNKNRKASSEQKPNRIRNRKKNQGKKRRKRNCFTKQPPYQWRTQNKLNDPVENKNDRRSKIDNVSNIDQTTIVLLYCYKHEPVISYGTYKSIDQLEPYRQ